MFICVFFLLGISSASRIRAPNIPLVKGGNDAISHRSTTHASLFTALDCLDPEVNIDTQLAEETSQMIITNDTDSLPGPQIVRIPLVHGSVLLKEFGLQSSGNCVEKAQPVVELENQVAFLEAAKGAFDVLTKYLDAKSDPFTFLSAEEKAVRIDTYREATAAMTQRGEGKLGSVIRAELDLLWNQHKIIGSRSSLEELATRLPSLGSRISTELADGKKLSERRRWREFGSNSCSAFSRVSLRIARFLSCLEETHINVKAGDGPAERFAEWGRGVYTRANSKWILMSRAAMKAVKFPSSWQEQTMKILALETSEAQKVSLSKCATELVPDGWQNSDLENMNSAKTQEQEARSLQCLPSLMTAPGFNGILVEEKERTTTEVVVDKQCVMPTTCGRLGAAVLTGWQARHYGGVGSWSKEWRTNSSGLINDDCTAMSSTKDFVCYDYSHRCFPAAMRYLCHVLPTCCPSLFDASTKRNRCQELTAEQFQRDSSPCDVCIAPAKVAPMIQGGSLKNLLSSIVGKSPLKAEVDRLKEGFLASEAERLS